DAPDTDHATPSPSRVCLAALAAALLASTLAWPAGEVAIKSVRTETDTASVNGKEQAIVTVLSSHRSDVKRATLSLGLQGAILGMALGLAGAALRRSAGAATAAVFAGLILGGGLGAGVSSQLFPIFFR